MKARIAAVAVVILIAIAITVRLTGTPPVSDAELAAWEAITPDLVRHTCAAPASETYTARDVHWTHVSPGGLTMAAPSPTGRNTLLGPFTPIGTLVWTEEGCEVVELETMTVTIQLLDAEGEPTEGLVASCPWTPITPTVDGVATLQLPIAARCKLAAYQIDGEHFLSSQAVPHEDLGELSLQLRPKQRSIAEQRAATLGALAQIEKFKGTGPYFRYLEATTDPSTRAVMERWQSEYEAHQSATLGALGTIARQDDGWMRLSR